MLGRGSSSSRVCSCAHVKPNPLGINRINPHPHHLGPIYTVWNSYPLKNLSLVSGKPIQFILRDNSFFSYPMWDLFFTHVLNSIHIITEEKEQKLMQAETCKYRIVLECCSTGSSRCHSTLLIADVTRRDQPTF